MTPVYELYDIAMTPTLACHGVMDILQQYNEGDLATNTSVVRAVVTNACPAACRPVVFSDR